MWSQQWGNIYDVVAPTNMPESSVDLTEILEERNFTPEQVIRTSEQFYTSIGLVTRLAPNTSVGAAYDWRQKLTSDGDEIQEFSLFLTQRLGPDWKVQLYALAGFSDASPESGGGVLLSHSF